MSAAATHPSVTVIEMRDVSAVAMLDPDRIVVEGVNWSVMAGDFWVLAGLHGTGKSDFLMMTAGLLAPAGGAYHLFGESMPIFQDARLPTRLRIGLVFDGGQLFNSLTLAENVALPLRYRRNLSAPEAEDRVRAVLDALELAPWAENTPGTVGRNWRTRVGLARALMLQPEVLLLDNPLAGLDLRHANWWFDFLGQLSAGHELFGGRPMTLVLTTGNLRSWQGHARQFALLKERRLLVLGGWPEVQQSAEPIVREMLAAGMPVAREDETELPRVSAEETR